jgi:hypothetical protein
MYFLAVELCNYRMQQGPMTAYNKKFRSMMKDPWFFRHVDLSNYVRISQIFLIFLSCFIL